MSHNIFILPSVFLFVLSFYLYSKAYISEVTKWLFFLIIFLSIFLFAAYGAAYYFTGNGIDEATIYHLRYGLGGSGFLEYSQLMGSTVAIIVLLIAGLIWVIRKWNKEEGSRLIASALYLSLCLSLILNPATIDLYSLYKDSLSYTDSMVETGKPATEMQTSFNKYYITPNIKATNEDNKNIVFIYAESLERTYFNEDIFPGLIRGLRQLESRSVYFTNIVQAAGTGWTVAGMTASQCGIPLFTPSHGNSMSGMDRFLSSAVCLGDLLKERGYQLDYMGGASIEFAGKGKLFETHGFTNISGRKKLQRKLANKDYQTAWGLYDDSLFNMVYQRFTELSKTGNKFGLFTLTLDTHHPNGHPSASCKGMEYEDGSNPILNAVACSDYLISNLINKIMASPYAKNTLIVLMSDHLAMRNSASELLKKQARRNLFMIIDPDNETPTQVDRFGSTLDVGVTILPFLGYDGDIGLGRNLLSNDFIALEQMYIYYKLRKWRPQIISLWNFPQLQRFLGINIDRKFVSIDSREFKIPLLIEFDNQSISAIKFEINNSPSHHSLARHRSKISEDKHFILVDKCNKVTELADQPSEGFCLLAGHGQEYATPLRVDRSVTFTANEIWQLLTPK